MTALRQSEQRYRSVVEHQSDLVCRYLPDTTLTFVNEAYCRFFGKRREELIGRRFIELIPEAERPAALKHVASLLRGGEPRIYEHNVLLPDGSLGRQQWIDHAIDVARRAASKNCRASDATSPIAGAPKRRFGRRRRACERPTSESAHWRTG